MSDIFTPRFAPPTHGTRGDDGIPDYVSADRNSPDLFLPPPGHHFYVYHNGVRLKHIIEANRRQGWAIGRHYVEEGGRTIFNDYDANGIGQHRHYEGTITFRLIPRGG